MNTDGLSGKVQTVLGQIDPQDLGITLMHEHLLMDRDCYFLWPEEASKRAYVNTPLTIDLVGIIRQVRHHNLDNGRLWDVQTAIDEVTSYKYSGGNSVVELTSIGIGRDPVGLARISRATGLHIVMGCSYYVPLSYPQDMDQKTVDEITAEIVRDITLGVGNTGVRAGIIGEVGCVWPMVDNVHKILMASAYAQAQTGAPISIHTGAHEDSPLEIMDILLAAGADPERVIMGHLDDRFYNDLGGVKSLADTGCYLEYDTFGTEDTSHDPYSIRRGNRMNDVQRLERIEFLIDQGHLDKIVISQDVCNKVQYTGYGGKGYAHILDNIVPRMKSRGFTDDQIQAILVDNPRRALTFR